MKVNFVDVSLKNSPLERKILREIRLILRSGAFVSGKYVQDFEDAFAHFLGAKDVVAVSSGTAALHLSLLALGLKPDQEVIIPSFTFAATAEAVLYCGATPVFVDIGADYTLDPLKVEMAITKRTVGMIPVHLFGHMADMEKLLQICQRNKLWIVEDACQAHGSSLRGKMAGTWGDLGVFSFYPTKNLGGIGEGGAIVTKEKKTAQILRSLRNHGSTTKYQHEVLGYNYRLNEIQAAALLSKLPFLEQWNRERQKIAAMYPSLLKDLPITFPIVRDNYSNVFHQFVIRTEKRDNLQIFLAERGIETTVSYPLPLHLQPAFRGKIKKSGPLPMTESMARQVLSLPIYPGLSIESVEKICQVIQRFFSRR